MEIRTGYKGTKHLHSKCFWCGQRKDIIPIVARQKQDSCSFRGSIYEPCAACDAVMRDRYVLILASTVRDREIPMLENVAYPTGDWIVLGRKEAGRYYGRIFGGNKGRYDSSKREKRSRGQHDICIYDSVGKLVGKLRKEGIVRENEDPEDMPQIREVAYQEVRRLAESRLPDGFFVVHKDRTETDIDPETVTAAQLAEWHAQGGTFCRMISC